MNWAVSLPITEADTLAGLRSLPDALALEADDLLWVRSNTWSRLVETELRKLPAHGRYEVLADGWLRPVAARLRQGRLPVGSWKPLRDLLPLALPVASFSGQVDAKVRLTLVRSANEKPAAALLTDIERWQRYAGGAAQVRLEPLSFAMDEEGRVIIRGHPVPSLPGTRFADCEGVLVPVGWHWSPAVSPVVVRSALGLNPDEIALWLTDGRIQRLHREQFLPVTRSAVRVSAAALMEVGDAGQ